MLIGVLFNEQRFLKYTLPKQNKLHCYWLIEVFTLTIKGNLPICEICAGKNSIV